MNENFGKRFKNRGRYHAKLHKKRALKAARYLRWHTKVTPTTSPFPFAAKIDICRRCNLNCRMCIRPTLESFEDMTQQNYIYILAQLKDASVISPHGYGEPLMHPDFLEMMRKTTIRGHKIHLTTNGTLLTPEIAEPFLKDCRPIQLTISVDAGTKEKYEWIRRGGDFHTLTENLTAIADIIKRNKLSTKTLLACTLGNWNTDQIAPMARLAFMTGIQSVTFSDLTLHGVGLAKEENAITSTPEQVRLDLTLAKKAFGKKVRIGYSVAKVKTGELRCERPWVSTFIDTGGTVFPCTDNLDYPVGNIFDTPFMEIWNNDMMREFRRMIVENPPEMCKKCPSY